MRLFIAINFDDNIKNNLREVINNLKSQAKSGSFSRIENLHITLAFLGEIPVEKVEILKDIMDGIKRDSFKLDLSHLGAFHRKGSPEALYWCGIKSNSILEEIQKDMVKALKEKGFVLDNKPFKPHITLARKCILPRDYLKEGNKAAVTGNISMIVNKISLMKSERINGVLTYTEIYKKQLQ